MRTHLISWFMIFALLSQTLMAIAFDPRKSKSVETDATSFHVGKLRAEIDGNYENAQGLGVEVVHAKKGTQGGSNVYKKPPKSNTSHRYLPVNLAQSVAFCAGIVANWLFQLA